MRIKAGVRIKNPSMGDVLMSLSAELLVTVALSVYVKFEEGGAFFF